MTTPPHRFPGTLLQAVYSNFVVVVVGATTNNLLYLQSNPILRSRMNGQLPISRLPTEILSQRSSKISKKTSVSLTELSFSGQNTLLRTQTPTYHNARRAQRSPKVRSGVPGNPNSLAPGTPCQVDAENVAPALLRAPTMTTWTTKLSTEEQEESQSSAEVQNQPRLFIRRGGLILQRTTTPTVIIK